MFLYQHHASFIKFYIHLKIAICAEAYIRYLTKLTISVLILYLSNR